MMCCAFLGIFAGLLLATPASAASSSSSFLTATGRGKEDPPEEEPGAEGAEADGECTEIAKEQFDVVYCNSYMCKECCTSWCTEQCKEYKEADRFGKCSCDGGDPEAAEESFCKDKNETYWKEHRDLPYEAMQSTACEKGCDSCCAAMKMFLQMGGPKVQADFRLPNSCKVCLDKHPLVKHPRANKAKQVSSNLAARKLGTLGHHEEHDWADDEHVQAKHPKELGLAPLRTSATKAAK